MYEEGSKAIGETIEEGSKYAPILPCITQVNLETLNDFPLEQSTSVFRCITDNISVTSQLFYDLVSDFNLQSNFEEHFANKKQSQLEEISLITIPDDIEEYTSQFAKPLQQSGYDEMVIHYFSSEEIDRLSQFEGIDENTAISLLEDIPTYDIETGKPSTLDKQLQKTIHNHPVLKDTAFGENPVRSGLMLYFDSKFIFVTPIIPISDNQLISVEEYCILEIDELYCDRLIKLGVLSHMAIKKDPALAIKSIEMFLILAKDINKETGAGLDSELEYATYYVEFINELDPQKLADGKLIETESGEFVSLNEISEIKYNGHKISIAKKALKFMGSEHKGKSNLLAEDFEIFIDIMNDLNEGNPSSIQYNTKIKPSVPKWIKWWPDNQISDSDFVDGIKDMIKNDMITVSSTKSSIGESERVPSWIKNNVEWWANDQISEEDLIRAIQYLLEKGVIRI
ncbi:MAG: hypothetical protein NPMRTH1_1250022 [Nitrosopumilales archaeon]|nr:MAG: hypothetical protein NPMRTH1_1250022 [Nitrosopumilales archaeon]